eukprot:9495858-Pyramimonas_sp.AAC.1
MCGIGRADLASYSEDLVSWPAAGTTPVSLESALQPADAAWLSDWGANVLRSPEETAQLRADLGLRRPYSDPALRDPKVYGRFLQLLFRRGMLQFSKWDGKAPTLGAFTVRKKGDRQRLIFDTRLVNLHFHRAPATELPTAAASRLESDASGP